MPSLSQKLPTILLWETRHTSSGPQRFYSSPAPHGSDCFKIRGCFLPPEQYRRTKKERSGLKSWSCFKFVSAAVWSTEDLGHLMCIWCTLHSWSMLFLLCCKYTESSSPRYWEHSASGPTRGETTLTYFL